MRCVYYAVVFVVIITLYFIVVAAIVLFRVRNTQLTAVRLMGESFQALSLFVWPGVAIE